MRAVGSELCVVGGMLQTPQPLILLRPLSWPVYSQWSFPPGLHRIPSGQTPTEWTRVQCASPHSICWTSTKPVKHFSSNHIRPPFFRPCGSWLINQACHLWGQALMLGLQSRFLCWSELLPSPPSHDWLETQSCFCSCDSYSKKHLQWLITTSYGETLPKLRLLNDNGFSSWRPAQASVFLMVAASTFLGNINIFT